MILVWLPHFDWNYRRWILVCVVVEGKILSDSPYQEAFVAISLKEDLVLYEQSCDFEILESKAGDSDLSQLSRKAYVDKCPFAVRYRHWFSSCCCQGDLSLMDYLRSQTPVEFWFSFLHRCDLQIHLQVTWKVVDFCLWDCLSSCY